MRKKGVDVFKKRQREIMRKGKKKTKKKCRTLTQGLKRMRNKLDWQEEEKKLQSYLQLIMDAACILTLHFCKGELVTYKLPFFLVQKKPSHIFFCFYRLLYS